MDNILIISVIICIVIICIVIIISIITPLFMENGQGTRGRDEWPWLNPNGGAKNMPGPYRPGPITPDRPAAEPKYNGPSGPSEPDFGDPGLTKKKN